MTQVDHFAIATEIFGPQHIELSRPPHDVRFGEKGSISVNLIEGTFEHRNKGYGGPLEVLDEIHEELTKKGNGADYHTTLEEYERGIEMEEEEENYTLDEEEYSESEPATDERAPKEGAPLEPDCDQLEIFTQALFRYCDLSGVVSLRSFHQNDANKSFSIKRAPLKDGLKPLIKAAVNEARRAANDPAPIAFTPPVATFKASAGWQAREEDLFEGPVLSVELDENPRAALATLQDLLGFATLVVRSGGEWTNRTTGEVEDKLHAHWRLKEPAQGKEQLDKLKQLRRVATTLVGGDRTNIPINHPIRWPGSWHRKSTPRLCEIVDTEHIDNEIDLDVALAALEGVTDLPPQLLSSKQGANLPPDEIQVSPELADLPFEDLWGDPYPKTAEPERIAAALAVIPNTQRLWALRGQKIDGSEDDPLDWYGWTTIGLAIWNATSGAPEGEAVFLTWSRKWPKYIAGTEAEKARFDRTTRERWEAFSKCPPEKIGAGTIFFLADKASPGWRQEYEARKGNDGETSGFGEIPLDNPDVEGGDVQGGDSGGGAGAPDSQDADPGEGVTLKDFFAYMPMHNYIYAPARDHWPASSVNARIPPIILGFDDNGNPITMPASDWLDRNKPVEQMTWSPGDPMLIRHRLISEGGWIERKNVSVFNLYRPPTIKLGNAAEAERWLDHVHRVYPDDADRIIVWLAHRRLKPQEKINHALVLGGLQGIGKDTLLEPAKRAVGPWNFSEVSPQQVLGRFNGFLKSVILRINEARDLGESDRFKFYDHMKAYTAAPPDVLRVDEKNLREHNVLNCCGVVITTNYKADGIYLPADDRRHDVAWSNLKKEDFTADYWIKLWGWYDSGGDRHVAAYLDALDISKFDPKAPPPKTAAFWDIVGANRAPEEGELADALDELDNPKATTLAKIAAEAGTDLAEWLHDRKNRRVFPHRLERCGYVPVRNDTAQDGLWKLHGARQVIYARADLSLRDRIIAARQLAGST